MNTLFLDRDGVINKCMSPGKYVTSWSEFEFIDGSVTAISSLRKFFKRIVVVTNQQGIGKNIFSLDSLKEIHENMQNCLRIDGSFIDKIYYCPHLKSIRCSCRKPKTGMAFQAQRDFPEINFSASAIVGDSPSDLEFGSSLGMKTILVRNRQFMTLKPSLYFDNLFEFSNYLTQHPNDLFS